MQYTARLRFGPFSCDIGNACLRRGKQMIRLTPKAFAVLRCLLERAGQLATKDEILQAVWPETTLSETVLAVAIRELRRALQDSARSPRFIETVHRRGYRFIAALHTVPDRYAPLPPGSPLSDSPLFPGRNVAPAQLRQWLTKSPGGETGVARTALVQAFEVWLYQLATGQWLGSHDEAEAARQVAEAHWHEAESGRQALLVRVAELEARLQRQQGQKG